MGEIQRAFASGEVSPTLYGRADVDRWSSALKTCRNWIVEPEGGVTVRQGFELVARIPFTYIGTKPTPKFTAFEYGPSDSHVLVSLAETFVLTNGVLAYGDPVISVTDVVSGGNLHTVTSTWALGYSTGDTISVLSGEVAGTSAAITSTGLSSFTFTAAATNGTYTVFMRRTALVSGSPGICKHRGVITGNYVQSADTLYVTNGSSDPFRFIRYSFNSTDRALSFQADYTKFKMPVDYSAVTLTPTAGSDIVRYVVTYTGGDDIESSVLRAPSSTPVSAIATGSTTWTITSVAHGLNTSDSIITADKPSAGSYEDDIVLRVKRVDADTFTVAGLGVPVSAATFKYYTFQGSSASATQPASASPTTVAWTAVPGAKQYNVYREYGRVYGYIGSTSDVQFIDKGIIPDAKDTPSFGNEPKASQYDYPTTVGLSQQRLWLGGWSADKERVTSSHSGNYLNFEPGAEDSSGLDFGLAGRAVSGVVHLAEVAGRLIVLTDTSEWVVKGGSNGITPTAINARTDSYYGSSTVPPCVVGSSLIYLQRGDKIVRDAKYDYSQEALASSDLTLWSKHLLKIGVQKMAYNRSEQILWCLLKDGTLAALTYIPDQNIWGWHRHDVQDRVIQDICVVSESGNDRLYIVYTDGNNVDVGRLPLRWESGDVNDHIGFDMALTYNGFYSGTTGTLTGGTNWTTDETLTLTASSSTFVIGDVGKDFLLKKDDEDVQVTCTAYTSGTVISVRPRTIVPVAIRGVACSEWAACASTFSGLTHLEGETVGVIADGGREPDSVVASGGITLSRPFSRVQVGLPITADIKTLDIEATNKDTSLGDFKHVTRVILRILNSRGLKAGLTEDTLEEMATEYTDVVNATPALQSGVREVLMSATHEDSGSIVVRQDQGLPATILNARTVFNVGDTR